MMQITTGTAKNMITSTVPRVREEPSSGSRLHVEGRGPSAQVRSQQVLRQVVSLMRVPLRIWQVKKSWFALKQSSQVEFEAAVKLAKQHIWALTSQFPTKTMQIKIKVIPLGALISKDPMKLEGGASCQADSSEFRCITVIGYGFLEVQQEIL